MSTDPSTTPASKREPAAPARNEPCPCGSGRKYKRCHGVGAAPQITPPKSAMPADFQAGAGTGAGDPGAGMSPFGAGGFDPSQMDPQMMLKMSQALQRLPKGQLQRLQNIMQKAMSGKDVSKDAAEFERTLPVEFQEMMKSFSMPGMGMPGMSGEVPAGFPDLSSDAIETPSLSEDEARAIVAKAAAEGKISQEQAEVLLKAGAAGPGTGAQPPLPEPAESTGGKGISKLWRGLGGGKKS